MSCLFSIFSRRGRVGRRHRKDTKLARQLVIGVLQQTFDWATSYKESFIQDLPEASSDGFSITTEEINININCDKSVSMANTPFFEGQSMNQFCFPYILVYALDNFDLWVDTLVRKGGFWQVRSPANWEQSSEMLPSIFSESFFGKYEYPAFFPLGVYTSQQILPTLRSKKTRATHTLIHLEIAEEACDELTRGEVVIATAAMMTRLAGDKFDDRKSYSNVPVMIISAFADQQVRILQAHATRDGLAISMTKILDFSKMRELRKNYKILLGLLASSLVGDPTDPAVVLKGHVSAKKMARIDSEYSEVDEKAGKLAVFIQEVDEMEL